VRESTAPPRTVREWLALALLVFLALLCTPASLHAEIIRVAAGESLSAAILRAVPGDEIQAQAGARFVAEFVLPEKPFGPAITVRTSAVLPERRITEAEKPLLATMASGVNAPVLTAGARRANWRFIGINFEPTPTWNNGTVIINEGADAITYDRCLILGPPNGVKRGILINGSNLIVTRSHIAGIYALGQDSQAIAGWNGTRNFVIADNFLEAASENVMLGGADSSSPENVPQDGLIDGNLFTKDFAWKTQTGRVVKNLFEIKAGKRVTIRNNVFERNWPDGQSGFSILFTVRNQDGAAPWSVIEDVLFEKNVIRDVTAGFNISGFDSLGSSLQTQRVTIRDNTIQAETRGFFVANEVGQLGIYRNTITLPAGQIALLLDATEVWPTGEAKRPTTLAVTDRFIWAENITNGSIHSATALGEAALKAYAPRYTLAVTSVETEAMTKQVLASAAVLSMLLTGSSAAQPIPADVKNPSAIAFEPSADHAAVTSYEVDILRPDNTVLQTINIGKPAVVNNVATAPVNVQPVAFGTGYSFRIRAIVGTATSDYTVSLNKFERAPGAPSKLVAK
jgi:hypothetical protein